LSLQILELGADVPAEPDRQWADALPGVRLASTAIEPWTIEVESAEWRSITYPVLSVSSKPLLAGGTNRSAIDHLPSLGLDHRALHGTGHGLSVLEAQTYQILGVPLDRCDVSAITRSGGVLYDQLDPHLHKDSLRPTRCQVTAEGARRSPAESVSGCELE
jgi:hypothetical protein